MALFLEFVSLQWHWFALLLLLFAVLTWYENISGPQTLSIHELGSVLNQANAELIDLRPAKEFREGHIAQAVNIPLDQWAKRSSEYAKKTTPIVLVCKYGQHAGGAGKELKKLGAPMASVYKLSGGMVEWQGEKLPIVKGV